MDVSVGNHRLVLLRHGETEWSRDRKHTSRTDLDLTDYGREQAKLAALTLERLELDNPLVVSSPRQRALTTAALSGLTVVEVSPLLAYDAQMLSWMRGLSGAPAATGLPNPLSLEEAGATLDRLVTTPNFPTS